MELFQSSPLLSYLSEQLRPKEARTREDAWWLCQPGLPEPFASSALHLKKWQQLQPFDSIKIDLVGMCSSLLAAYWPNCTITANNSWLHSERLRFVRRGKKEGVTAAALQFYQYLCCKEWHLQLFHNYLAGLAAIHLQNCCYDRWRASSTITRTHAVKHIYFTTQHLPSVFSEALMACWYYLAFYSCFHILKNRFFFFLSGWIYDS